MMRQLFTSGHANKHALVAASKWQSLVCLDIKTPAYKPEQLNSSFVGGELD